MHNLLKLLPKPLLSYLGQFGPIPESSAHSCRFSPDRPGTPHHSRVSPGHRCHSSGHVGCNIWSWTGCQHQTGWTHISYSAAVGYAHVLDLTREGHYQNEMHASVNVIVLQFCALLLKLIQLTVLIKLIKHVSTALFIIYRPLQQYSVSFWSDPLWSETFGFLVNSLSRNFEFYCEYFQRLPWISACIMVSFIHWCLCHID